MADASPDRVDGCCDKGGINLEVSPAENVLKKDANVDTRKLALSSG